MLTISSCRNRITKVYICKVCISGSEFKSSVKAVHKHNYVSGEAAGWIYAVRLGTFFFIFFFFFILFIHTIFLQKKKKKNSATAQLATILATRWTENRLFFMNSLTIAKYLGRIIVKQ